MTFGVLVRICSSCAQIRLHQGVLRRGLPTILFSTTLEQRDFNTKHFDPKFRRERKAKIHKIDLPDFQKFKRESNMSPEEKRAYMKREGIEPSRSHQERDFLIACTGTIFDQYIPPEGDGKASIVSGQRAKQMSVGVGKKGRSFFHLKKIRAYEKLDSAEFAEQALEIYKEAHSLLSDYKKNSGRLHQLVTEKAYPEMVWRLDKASYRWQYIKGLEPPRIVHIRVEALLSKDNLYAQVTVRLHSQQTLAIYDRFGRLSYGSEHLVKDVLEYVVFEKYLSDENSLWRIHGKVIPDWLQKAHNIRRTLRVPDIEEEIEQDEETANVST